MAEWAKLVAVPILVALVIAILSPLGDGARELLFPTRATVSGTVTMAGRSVEGAVLELGGAVVGSTDAAGVFLVPGVDDGAHILQVRAAGAEPGRLPVTVARGAADVRAGTLELRPLVEVGFVIGSLDLRPPGRRSTPGAFVLDYDITLWLVGDTATLDRIVSVAYVLPSPFPSATVDATSRAEAFCSRQAGELTVDTLLGSPGIETVSATVGLDDATSFTVLGRPGELPAPPCATSSATGVAAGPAAGGGAGPGPGPTAAPIPTTTPPVTTTATPAPTGPRILSLTSTAALGCGAATGGVVTLTYDVRDADEFEVVLDGGNTVGRGALSKAPTSERFPFPCDGQPHTYVMTVSSAAGGRSEPRAVTVAP